LKSQNRDATLVKDRKAIQVLAAHQHDNEFIHQIEFPGLGRLEAIPNGDATYFCGLLNVFEGLKDGQRISMTCSLSIERDLNTGLMAMSMGVAYPACIVAEMIVKGKIERKGVLSPTKDIPPDFFMTD